MSTEELVYLRRAAEGKAFPLDNASAIALLDELLEIRERAINLRADPDFTPMCEAGFPELTTLMDVASGSSFRVRSE